MDFPKTVPGVGLVDGKFVDEDAVLGRQGSLIPSAWGNAVTEELLAVIDGLGEAPNEADQGQLARLLLRNPTESLRGMPLVATQAETNTGTNDARVVTPKKLRAGFAISIAANGYITFPSWMGGLIIQWGVAPSNSDSESVYAFPLSFPTMCRGVVATAARTTDATIASIYSGVRLISAGQFGIRNNAGSTNNSFWIAIGN